VSDGGGDGGGVCCCGTCDLLARDGDFPGQPHISQTLNGRGRRLGSVVKA